MIVSVPSIAAPLDRLECVARILWAGAVALMRTALSHWTNVVPRMRRLVEGVIAGQLAPYAVMVGKRLVIAATAVVVTIAVAQMRFAAIMQPFLYVVTRERAAAVKIAVRKEHFVAKIS